MKLVFATQNPSKVNEVKQLLVDLDIELITSSQAGIIEDVIEDQDTFEGNSLKKAREISQKVNQWVIAEDAGICIKALDGKPGVYSARWAGEGASDQDIVNHTLKQLKGVPEGKRGAWFECVVTLYSPKGEYWFFIGKTLGAITLEPVGQGRQKFPYDLIFMPDGYDITYTQMTDEQKNNLSHRCKALVELKQFLIKNKVLN